jgi:hypothetical protein
VHQVDRVCAEITDLEIAPSSYLHAQGRAEVFETSGNTGSSHFQWYQGTTPIPGVEQYLGDCETKLEKVPESHIPLPEDESRDHFLRHSS